MTNDKPTALVIVIDAVGVSTLEYLFSNYSGKLRLPNLSRLGLGRALKKDYASRLGPDKHKSYAAAVCQASASADSVIGHREMMGVIDSATYDLFPEGFACGYIAELEKKIGRKTIFNKMAGGMEAIKLNADEHEKTGFPIVYASKCDPLIQLAMNESVIPVREQHAIADAAFDLAMEMKVPVTRAIARAYVKTAQGEIIRTANRHDAVLPMKGKNLVDILRFRDIWAVAVGKTSDLVNTAYDEKIKLTSPAFLVPALKRGFVHPGKKDTNPYAAQGIMNALVSAKFVFRPKGTFIFANLVDTDSLYGHTRDVNGAVKCLEEFDRMLPLLKKNMKKGDLLIITADHGMAHREDYGYHNNEPLPLLAERIGYANLGGLLPGKGKTLCDVGYMISQIFGCRDEFIRECGLTGFFPSQ